MAKGFTYKIELDANISALKDQLAAAKQALDKAFGEGSAPTGMQKAIDAITAKINALTSKAATPAKSESVFGSMEKDVHSIEQAIASLIDETNDFQKKTTKQKFNLLPADAQKKVSGFIAKLEALRNATIKLQNATSQQAETQSNLQDLLKRSNTLAADKASLEATIQKIKANKELYEAIKQQIEARQEEARQQGKTYDPSKANFSDGNGGYINGAVAAKGLDEYETELKRVTAAYTSLQQQIGRAQNALSSSQTTTADAQKAFQLARDEARKFGISLKGISTAGTQADIDALNQRIEEQMQLALADANVGLAALDNATNELSDAAKRAIDEIHQENAAFREQNDAAGEVSGLMSRIKQFTGLTGAAIIMRRALQQAFNTIQELDKQMTEMAVVTDLEVSDYWRQLPEHTERANALGIAIKDVYEAETLYYQQGLKSAEVTELSTSTLKMARIAGLSAAEATNKMTAALRGFNMELDQTSADRVADVYSKLAAITASDVKEISTAMTKTASLASNAGMDFETTAAFLAQIIETTRESAETAGTALKTVIARFQELKKSPEEIGEVDGEIIDANKIETALRSVGVSLRDAQGQFRDLGSVFLELSEKWDGLSTNTQRYIATIAAGSRQQSRFIAMMSNYSRTMELVSAANNAAGASQEQFDKTLESVQTKLAQLKNAWDTFTQGLLNNEAIKQIITLLTDLLNLLNSITEGTGPFTSSILKITTLIATFKTADVVLKAFTTTWRTTNSVAAASKAAFSAPWQALQKLIQGNYGNAKALSAYHAAQAKSIKAQAAYTAAAQRETEIINRNQNAAKLSAQAKQEQTEATQRATVAQQEAAIASQNAADAEWNLIASYQLSSDQTKEYIALKDLDISTTDALLLAKNGVTASTYTSMTAEEQEALLKKLNTTLNLKEALSIKLTNAARGISNNVIYKAIFAKRAETVATLAETSANAGLTASFYALWTALWPILLIMGALAAAIAAVVLISKAIYNNSAAGRLEAARESLKSMTEQANAAKDAYTHLTDSISKYEEAQTALDNLVVGTAAWRDALAEVNSIVTSLIEEFPQLASAVTIDKDGKLIIDSGKLDQAQREAQSAVFGSQTAVAYSQIAVERQEAEKAYDDLYINELNHREELAKLTREAFSPDGESVPMIDFSQFQELNAAVSEALANNQLIYLNDDGTINTENIASFAQQHGSLNEAQAKLYAEVFDSVWISQLKDWGDAKQDIERQTELAQQQLISGVIGAADTAMLTSQQKKQMSQAGSIIADNLYSAATDAVELQLKNDLAMYKTQVKQYYKALGYNVQRVRDTGAVEYLDDQSKTQTIAAKNVQDAMVSNRVIKTGSNLLPKAITSLTTSLAQALFSDLEGNALTREQSDMGWYNLFNLRQEFKANTALQQLYNNDLDQFLADAATRMGLSSQRFEKADSTARTWGIDIEKLTKGFTSSSVEALVHDMVLLTANSGVDTATNFVESLQNMAGADWSTVADALSSLDWQSVESLDQLPTLLEQMGIQLPQAQLQNFINGLKDTNKALANVDWENMRKALPAIGTIISKIQTNEQGRIFDSSAYEAIIDFNPYLAKDFQDNLDGTFTLITNNIDDWADELIDRTLGEISRQRNKVDVESWVAQYWEDAVSRVILLNGPDEKRKGLLSTMVTDAQKQGIDLSWISPYLSNPAALAGATDQDVAALASTVLGLDITTLRSKSQTIQDRLTTARTMESAPINYRDIITDETSRASIYNQGVAASVSSVLLDRANALERALKETPNDKVIQEDIKAVYKTIANQSAYSVMVERMKADVSQWNEAWTTYQKAANPQEQRRQLQSMVEEFGIEVTDANHQAIYQAFEQLFAGDEQGYKTLIDMAAGDIDNAYATLATKTFDVNSELYGFAKEMADAGRGYFEAVDEGLYRFHWGLDDLLDEIDEVGLALERWWNPYDWLWNANQQINAVLRERQRLEREWMLMTEDHYGTYDQMKKNLEDQVRLTQDLAKRYAEENDNAYQQLEDLYYAIQQEGGPLEGILGIGAEGRIIIDKDRLDALQLDASMGEHVDDQVNLLLSIVDTLRSTEDSVNEAQDRMREIRNIGKEQYTNLIDQTATALRNQRQQIIDEMSTINDAINDARSALVDKIQEKIDDDRQARANEKTERELADKNARLAYLQASGGNAVEILKLQKEISEAQESYTDSLVDQSIEETRRANEYAAEQRQQQIDIAQAQYDWWSEHEALKDAEIAVNEALSSDGFVNSSLAALLSGDQNVAAMTAVGQTDWENSLKTDSNLAKIFRASIVSAEGEQTIADLVKDIRERQSGLDLGMTGKEAQEAARTYGEADLAVITDKWNADIAAMGAAANKYLGRPSPLDELREIFDATGISPTDQDVLNLDFTMSDGRSVYDVWKAYGKPKFASGGLADFTGPAWLDGTASAPELVLNATDTANFIALKDILSEIMRGASNRASGQSLGNNYYDIEVHVDSIDSDYDVDQAVERMKELIESDAMYRNVNAVQKTR